MGSAVNLGKGTNSFGLNNRQHCTHPESSVDGSAELKQLAQFIADSLGIQTLWHVSRFYPTCKLSDRPPTPVKTVLKAREIGLNCGLKYVYTGNVPGEEGEDTVCHACGATLVERPGFSCAIEQNRKRQVPRPRR
jgi:pyruvate formate lyase activating enzyme